MKTSALLKEQHEEKELFAKAEKALGESSDVLYHKMKALFERTMKAGNERAVERGGSAVTPASAPNAAAHS